MCVFGRGEKYMGLWVDEKRHGSGVVVTQYGVYYEGTFRDNKMSVSDALPTEGTTDGATLTNGTRIVGSGSVNDDKNSLCVSLTGLWSAGVG